jgi:hypothetical protein
MELPKVVSYLDCGCAIRDDGKRMLCPTCASGQTNYCPNCEAQSKRIAGLKKHLNVLLFHNPEPCDICYEDRCGGALECDCSCHEDAKKMREDAIAALKGGE